jgi:hypothetical protein
MEIEKYAVLEHVEYYGGDVQHPSGWGLEVATITDNSQYPTDVVCIGSLDECQVWLEQLNAAPYYLSHGQAGQWYSIAEVLDDDTDYQSWLDSLDWEGCPSEDGSDYDANTAWAEDRAYYNKDILPIQYPGNSKLVLVNLTI